MRQRRNGTGPGRTGIPLPFFHFFALLASYSMLRPLRDEIAVRSGLSRLPWLFSASLAATLAAVPLFGWLVSRCRRRRVLPGLNLFFASNLALFFLLFRNASARALAASAFFLWLNVFSLFAVSLSWSLMSELFEAGDARRSFARIACGATAGSIAGPAATIFAVRVGRPEILFLAGAALLCGCAASAHRLLAEGPAQGRPDAAIGGGPVAGIVRTFRSPFLLRISLVMACFAMLSTFGFLSQTEVVRSHLHDPAARTSFFASVDLAVNLVTIAIQLFVAGRVIGRIGPARALAVVSAAVGIAVAGVAVAPGLATIAVLQLLLRAGQFAVGRPARESLFVSLDLETRFKAKCFIDTVVSRASDAGSAWILTALRALCGGIRVEACLLLAVVVIWTAANARLDPPVPEVVS